MDGRFSVAQLGRLSGVPWITHGSKPWIPIPTALRSKTGIIMVVRCKEERARERPLYSEGLAALGPMRCRPQHTGCGETRAPKAFFGV